jgi:proline iminopeptidase
MVFLSNVFLFQTLPLSMIQRRQARHANLLSLNPLPVRPDSMNLLRASAFFLFVVTPVFATPPAVPHTTGVAHTEQVDLGYETFGTLGRALPIIVVNGGPGLSHAYMMQNDLWQRIGRHRLVVLYDQRGTGASKHVQNTVSHAVDPKDGRSQSMDTQVADLDAVRQALGLTKFALLGDSFGGWIAMSYARDHPEHVAKLILSDSPGPSGESTVHFLSDVFPDIEEQDKQEQQKLGPMTEAAARASLRNHFRMIFYSPEKRDAYMSRMGDLGFEPIILQTAAMATANFNFVSFAEFQFPTLVINGRYDMNVAPATAWELSHAIAGAKLVFFEKSGHLPAYEEPDKYIEVLEAFLNSK